MNGPGQTDAKEHPPPGSPARRRRPGGNGATAHCDRSCLLADALLVRVRRRSGGTSDITGGQVNARPNMVCDPMRGVTGSNPTGTPFVINVSCFARPTRLGDIGNMPRNAVRLPSIFNNDLAFFKNVPLGEKRSIQLRWEIYNVFNHTNFRDIDGTLRLDCVAVPAGQTPPATPQGTCTTALPIVAQTNTRFGTPIGARTPRVMQASIRFNF